MICDHLFAGSHDGVECLLCGLRMTHDEYVSFCGGLKPPQKDHSDKKRRGRPQKKVSEHG